MLKEALDGLGDEQSAVRAIALAMYSNHAGWDLGIETFRLTDDAVQIATRTGDHRAAALAYMYGFLNRLAGSDIDPEIDPLPSARAMLPVAEVSGDPELLRAARICCYWGLMRVCEVEEAERHMREHVLITNATRIPADMHVSEACLASMALLRGRFDEAEERIERAGLFDRQTVLAAYETWVGQLALLRTLQGRVDEAFHVLDSSEPARLHEIREIDRSLTIDTLRVVAAASSADVQRTSAAVESFARPRGARPIPAYRTARATALPDAYAVLGDRESALRLYPRVLPWAERSAGFILYISAGCYSRQLGVLATTLEQYDDAERHFDDAIAMNTRMGARPWVARTQLDYARMLLRRDSAGDRTRARELLETARAAARDMGMAGVERDCGRLLAGM
jgi:tetratricopeptide (TPR) repeat protein